jgi:hypothetical protein
MARKLLLPLSVTLLFCVSMAAQSTRKAPDPNRLAVRLQNPANVIPDYGRTQRETAEARAQGGVHGDATTACQATFASGTGHNASQFCVTLNGNITQFSRGGEEMINFGSIGEGYGICDLNSDTQYYDYAYIDSGNWLSPTFTQSGNVVTVTRLTSDGIWQLKQTITNVPANATSPASAKVSMALKNLTGVTRSAYFLRYADVDADSDSGDNDFDYTVDTAYGLEPGFPNGGLSTTNSTYTFSYDAFTQPTYQGPGPCGGWTVADQPFNGDGSIVQLYVVTVPHGATKTVISTYKPI